jgi:hypothetical protein
VNFTNLLASFFEERRYEFQYQIFKIKVIYQKIVSSGLKEETGSFKFEQFLSSFLSISLKGDLCSQVTYSV